MNTIATEQLWIDFGLDSAVFLDFIAHWVHLNASNKQPRNYNEGRYWTYNTLDALHSIFPGWPKETIRNIIRKCVKNGLLIVGNFNKKKFDRTNWYSLSDLSLKYYPKLSHLIQQTPDNPGGVSCGDFTARCGKSNTPIPKRLTSLSNINITNSEFDNSHSSSNVDRVKSDYSGNCNYDDLEATDAVNTVDYDTRSGYQKNQNEKGACLSKPEQVSESRQCTRAPQGKSSSIKAGKGGNAMLMELIDVYRKEFPNNPQPHARVIATSLQRTLLTLIKKWPELDPNGNPLTPQAFQKYLSLLRTTAPKFSLGQYQTPSGNFKKNSLETFARWNTVVKFLENAYS